jgi:signal peptidase II
LVRILNSIKNKNTLIRTNIKAPLNKAGLFTLIEISGLYLYMKAQGFLRIILILLMLSLTIGCDQLSKAIVRHKMNDYDQISFMNNHFNLIKVENTGAFLSVGNTLSGPLRLILLNLLPLLAVVAGLVFILTRNLSRITLFSIILVVGGGFGNLYDRIVHGSVTDFMHINFGFFQTGIFNVADVSITAGMIMLFIQALFERKKVFVETEN